MLETRDGDDTEHSDDLTTTGTTVELIDHRELGIEYSNFEKIRNRVFAALVVLNFITKI